MINTLIIDDDDDSRLISSAFIRKNCPDFEITGEAGSVAEGLRLVETTKPDLILLDIEMPDGTGFDLLRKTTEKGFEVIFITAFNDYAIQAFRYAAIDYLLKPVSFADLKDSLEKVEEKLKLRAFGQQWATLSDNLSRKNHYDKKIAIGNVSGYSFVEVKDIIYCESAGNYTSFYFSGGKKIVSSKTLGFYEELLPPEKFYRIHNSHLINTDYLEQYIKGGRGGTVVMKNGAELEVSQRKKADFLDKFIPGHTGGQS